ncbi:MAG TPA: T9SS type A sorting domain-containing protein [Saprospiraceae bacterium]|nr:T9SS type A sorting domain-containing protein [Saprospiraceae bacterium]
MNNKYSCAFIALIIMLGFLSFINAQNNCNPTVAVDSASYEGVAYFNYGSTSKSKSQKYLTALSVGQVFTGYVDNSSYSSTVGFYGRYLLPPFALKVNASQGDLLDRIQLSWEIDALGPSPNEGFNIYRDDIFLASVGPNIRNYNDFNVIAGVAYQYSVRGLNAYGEGNESYALGFQVPNGVVTGWVKTLSGNPVPNTQITLMPMQGFSAKFDATDAATASVNNDSSFIPDHADWTMTFYIKTDSANVNAGVISIGEILLYVRAKNSSSGHEGIELATLPSAAPFLAADFVDSLKNEWNHVTLTYEEVTKIMRLYINGALVGLAPFNDNVPVGEEVSNEVFFKLGNTENGGGWNGKIDELRIYSTLFSELDIPEIMHGTASSQTPNLDFYWKMDEELGEKSYDIKNRLKLFFCGVTFDSDIPPVRTAGTTNEEGYYRIESASYGTGTTFLAEPMKSFYLHKAIKFTRNSNSLASIPNFAIPKKSTLELWVNTSGAAGPQTILSKKSTGNELRIYLEPSGINQTLKVLLNGSSHSFGFLGNGYQHLAMTLDSASGTLHLFKNGVAIGSHSFGSLVGNLSEGNHLWNLGAHDGGDYYNGLIDEFAVYDTILSPSQITNHYNNARDMQEADLFVYFPMDEGAGNRISNVGPLFMEFGSLTNAGWSSFSPNQEEEPHVFTPRTRQVTLNPSVTSVDQVDFTDQSTVAVSGYVRYKNTDCFAPNVEILVNGTSYNPKIYTDSTGKFSIDFDPGATARLEPKFEDHNFVPAFWDVTNVSSPIAGIIFNDVTTRKVSGQVAGGLCRKSVIKAPAGDPQNQGTVCVVEVRAVNGCLVRAITIDNQEGDFEFLELPPLEKMTVAVIEHSNADIKNAFQVQGGSTVDLTKSDTIVDFIYFAPPEVEIATGLDTVPNCLPAKIVLEKSENITLEIKVKETYISTPLDDGICYLDTADLQIINGFSDTRIDTTLSGGNLQYLFRVGNPNPSPPYLKTLQIIATSVPAGRIGSLTKQAIVTGTVNKLQTFTTMMPFMPSVILRDPPGDGSSSFIEKTEKVCKTTELSMEVEAGVSGSVDIEIAPTIQFVVAPFGLGKIVTVDPDFQINIETEVTYSKVTSNSFQTCVSFNNRIATNDGELIVGGERGGDLYVGEAINLVFGFADKVSFDTCTVDVKQIVEVEPGNFATTFVYSEFNIKNNVIRYLNELSESMDTDSADRVNYLESIDRWEAIINRNDSLKQKAKLVRNLSFDAGVEYAYSETADTTDTKFDQNGVNTDSKIGTTFGFSGDNAGAKFKVNAIVKSSNTWKTENGTEKGLTTGYTLKDNDPGDAFTVDVAMDTVYKTPVFRIRAGQSSCPWEPGTANREAPNLQIGEGSQFTAVNVPANEPAVFKLNLGNLSATNEDWTYGFTAIAGSNPDGAIIKVNGQPLNNNTIQYVVPYNSSIPITLTVERGPIAYEYEGLKVALVSECELARDFALSLQSDSMFFSAIDLGVDFIRPCSEVNINVPEQNWVVINNDPLQPGTLRRITVTGYDLNSPDFQLIRLQYRRTDGNGAWINLPTPTGIYEAYNPKWSGFNSIPNDPDTLLLQPDFTQFMWDTDEIADGNYEIHAWAVCSGDASDKPGYSDIIKGKIDREPPKLVGVPQPSDGVFHLGDEISFTFNQDINCNKIIQADLLNANNVGLYDAETGQLIDATISCAGNKIVINPNFQNKFFENKIMRAELHNIQDLTGNVMLAADWEFYVDRNELAWLTDSIEIVKYADESKTVSAKIHNRGGYPVPYSFVNLPAWVHVYPDRGTLVANEIQEVFFTVGKDLDLGMIEDTIILKTETGINPFFMGGTENLNLRNTNLCRPENWVMNFDGFNSNNYSYSMNFILQLNIEGTLSSDENDIVGAYVGNELRGIAKIEYQPSINKYIAFMTVYSNATNGELIKFQIWDASDCKLYAYAQESFNFAADDIEGTITNCTVLHTSGTLLRKIYLNEGWNWISMNLDLTPNTTNAGLASLSSPQGALIKNQTTFSAYSNSASMWIGSLNTLSPITMYQYHAPVEDSISLVGHYIDPETRSIPLMAGWNWIGYLPTQRQSIGDALSSLSPQNGDIIKSQLHFAQYLTGVGWVGNLKTMEAPKGYLIKLAQLDTLVYPDPLNITSSIGQSARSVFTNQDHKALESDNTVEATAATQWQVNAANYEYSMNAIAIVVKGEDDINLLKDGDEVGVFTGNEVRGSGKAIYIPILNAHMVFITMYANTEGEVLNLRYYDSATAQVLPLVEKFNFKANSIIGQADEPQLLHLSDLTSSVEVENDHALGIYPNPFSSTLHIRHTVNKAQEIKVRMLDVLGNEVDQRTFQAKAGKNTWEWKPTEGLSGGAYMILLESESGVASQKVLYLR